jgi:hypothetical protein
MMHDTSCHRWRARCRRPGTGQGGHTGAGTVP